MFNDWKWFPGLLTAALLMSACATPGGGSMGPEANAACNGDKGDPYACVTPLIQGGGCYSGGFESYIVNDHKSKVVIAKVETIQRPSAAGSKYPKIETYRLEPGASKLVGCSRGAVAGRWLYYSDVISARFEGAK